MSAAHAEAGRGWEGTGVGGGSRRSRVDAETASYLKEIVEAAKGVEDEEQKTAMFSSALDEIAGIELMVLSDAECSRLVEELVSGGTIHVTIKLLTVFADGDKFFELSTRQGPATRPLPCNLCFLCHGEVCLQQRQPSRLPLTAARCWGTG